MQYPLRRDTTNQTNPKMYLLKQNIIYIIQAEKIHRTIFKGEIAVENKNIYYLHAKGNEPMVSDKEG